MTNGADKPTLDTKIDHTLVFSPRGADPGVAMSEQQYTRIQSRIHGEVGRGAATSIWLALAFAFFGFAATLVVTLATLDTHVVSGTTRGRLQGLLIGALVAAVLCLVMHGGKWMRDRQAANDICREMDLYCHRVGDDKKEEKGWSRLAFWPSFSRDSIELSIDPIVLRSIPSNSTSEEAPTLLVRRATYGDGQNDIDVTSRLNALIQGDRLDFIADNATMGDDPAVGVGKNLRITYVHDSREYSNSFAEGTHIVLP